MGQEEIINFLREKRQAGDNKYYFIKEISEGLADKPCSCLQHNVSKGVVALSRKGIIEGKAQGDPIRNWRRGYRLVDKYVNLSEVNN